MIYQRQYFIGTSDHSKWEKSGIGSEKAVPRNTFKLPALQAIAFHTIQNMLPWLPLIPHEFPAQ